MTRHERIKEKRENRIQRAIDEIEGRNKGKTKMSRVNKITLMVIVFFLLFGFAISSMYSKKTVFPFKKDEFINKYEDFADNFGEDFIYSKGILKLIENKNETIFFQKSSNITNSLISIYELNGKVEKIAAIGKIKIDEAFEKGYIENMETVLSIIFNFDKNQSLNALKNLKIIDSNGSIIFRKKMYKIRYEDYDMVFSKNNDSLIFAVEKIKNHK